MRRPTAALTTTTLALAAMAVTACSAAAPSREGLPAGAETTALTGKLHATAKEAFVRPNGKPVRLNGPNLQPIWDANSSGTWNQATYNAIKAKGFTGVRMVLFWDDFEPRKGAWNEKAFTTLSTALARAKSAGLYVVLDCVHLYGKPEGQSRVPAWARKADGMGAVAANGLRFLQQLASRYGKNPALAAYDPVNEPYRWPVNHKSVLADYTKIVNAIRAKDAKTTIVLEPTYGDAKVPVSAFASFKPAKRTNLVWSIHDYYVGNAGAGYDRNGIGTSPNASDGKTGYRPADKANLAKHLNVQLAMARSVKLPVWIGEFGIGARAAGHDQFIKDKVALYKSKGIGYSWWEYHDGSGAFSMINANGTWKPWATWVR
ncbi:cellulase family glycosylhydrolase [Actinomadura fulvescens]|uniref:Glycoside hydrolase family 5 domain-containing protein n=1 Tax=Actinomadura fulvescens TaxID=46160 RepID=A0ABN3QAI9_9ACTN